MQRHVIAVIPPGLEPACGATLELQVVTASMHVDTLPVEAESLPGCAHLAKTAHSL